MRFPKRHLMTATALLLASGLMTGCVGGGGGSGGGSTNEPSADAPVETSSANETTQSDELPKGTLSWVEPSENADGSSLRDLIGYRLSYGLSPDHYTETQALDLNDVECEAQEDDTRLCSYNLSDLGSASWYVSLQSVDMDGNVSSASEPVVITIE